MKRSCMVALVVLNAWSCDRGAATAPSSAPSVPSARTPPNAPSVEPSVPTTATSASPVALANGSGTYTLLQSCRHVGGRLRTETVTLQMPTGAVTVVDNGAITGEMYATATEAAPMRATVADPSFEMLLAESLTGELHGEGTRCTLTFTTGGKSRTQKWSSYDKPSEVAATAKRNVVNTFATLAKQARATRLGGDCTTDADCHFAPGADCRCYAAGPPATAGKLSRCLADPCTNHDKPRCERAIHRCVLGKPVATP